MIKSLTSLRFIFILFIFLHHCKGYVGGGTMAVSFFFILGGFCMFLGYKDRIFVDSFNYGRYITRRALKFYPLHWICLFTVLLLSTSFLQVPFDWTKVPIFLSNFALLHTWVPLEDYYFSYNSVSWYLADTMFFACLFPLLYRWIMGTDRRGRICIFLMFVLLYVIVAIFVPSDRWHAILYISPYIRVTDFIFGFFLAVFYCNIKDSSKIKCFFKNGSFNFLLIFALIGALVFESFYLGRFQLIAPFYWPLIALLILTATLSDRSKGLFSLLENKYIVLLGECSFTFFMIHTIILKNIHVVFHGALLFYIALTIICSLIIDRFVLVPITQWLTKIIFPSMTAHS